MKPYPENTNATRIARIFNYRLSRARMTAENTFGQWKGRFIRFAKRVDIEVSSLGSIVVASCILHNICEVQYNAFLCHWELQHVNDNNANDAVDIRDFRFAQYFTLRPH